MLALVRRHAYAGNVPVWAWDPPVIIHWLLPLIDCLIVEPLGIPGYKKATHTANRSPDAQSTRLLGIL